MPLMDGIFVEAPVARINRLEIYCFPSISIVFLLIKTAHPVI